MDLVFVDLELARSGHFHALAARTADGREQLWSDVPFARAHAELVAWLGPDPVLVGHNLHRFDRPALARRFADSPLLACPTLDTLELSVLAFPGRPYHRLAKDDRLVRDAILDPISDVRAAAVVLNDAIAALSELPEAEARVLGGLLAHLDLPPTARRGLDHLFGVLGWPRHPGLPELRRAWEGRACRHACDVPVDWPLVMVAAWLRVADRHDGSVLPRWVRHTWPAVTPLLRSLRATPCTDPACGWCATHHSPEHWLHMVFGFDGFRAEPAAPDGGSLQRLLVQRGLDGASTFGILPTGGGKSLCYQVPAEARHRRTGALTLVISPLQSLMKDQVDALTQRIPHARAIYSGLPALLRPRILEEVRTGACGLLYLAPEQLRNRRMLDLLAQRELGALVFDEAHCLSQWGHDFRTDYPYVLKAIRELCAGQGVPLPPVFLFTATGQHDAVQQILDHVEVETGERPALFDGGSARANLTYEVRAVPHRERLATLVELLDTHLVGGGSAIVFCGSRHGTEDVAAALVDHGREAVAYHAGLKPDERRALQDAFLEGAHQIVVATNAFGMGVDKADVRLVVHHEMPSSLESWLQEAGRAGRDGRPASAVLLWAEADAEPRFALGALADLELEDLRALWRAIEQLPATRERGRERRVVTPRELLFTEALTGRFDPHDASEQTRVKAAVNWLERALVVERRENVTRVFTGRPHVATVAEAHARVEALGLPADREAAWKRALEALFDAGDAGLSADDLAVACQLMTPDDHLEAGLQALSMLDAMAAEGLVSQGQTFSAIVSCGVRDSSERRLARWRAHEDQVLAWLGEAEERTTVQVHLRAIAQRLSTETVCTPLELARLLGTWTSAGDGLSAAVVRPAFRHHRGDTGSLTPGVSLATLSGWLDVRQEVARRALEHLVGMAVGSGKQIPVSSDLESVVAAVQTDLFLAPKLIDAPMAVRAAVDWLHELRVITVTNGLAVFRAAMRLDREPEWPGLSDRRARQALGALAEHQSHKVLRVHVMDRWARLMQHDPDAAEAMRADWFALPLEAFRARWLADAAEAVARPTSPRSYHAIVTALGDRDQQAIVTRDVRRNHLVLAGPGSGKTRVLVHRVAWLLRCHRVRPNQILVVCYTRANALELRRRLEDLVDADARRVRIQTLHGVALGMVGAHRLADGDLTLQNCLRAATAMLEGAELDPAGQSRQRDALLRGFTYLFVDEYQDIDADSYALLSAIAGRSRDQQRKLRVFAVGDDDQAIFGYTGASTDFIRSFEQDYGATRFVIPSNWRNPRAVLDLAQTLVAPLPDRLKAGIDLEVDAARRDEPPLGPWATAHPDLRGTIPWIRSRTVQGAAMALMERVGTWLDAGEPPGAFGILARSWQGLYRLRLAAEALRVPFRWTLPAGDRLPLWHVREVVRLREALDSPERIGAHHLHRVLDDLDPTPWVEALRAWLAPHHGKRRDAAWWTHDLFLWATRERGARTVGDGVHLGTMHSAKGLEFDHVLLLDDGTLGDKPEDRRLLYVALTRTRRSLHLSSTTRPSRLFTTLRSPHLVEEERPDLAADAPVERAYGLLDGDDQWVDWLGRQDPRHPGHAALDAARPGDRFHLRGATVVDDAGRAVARLSRKGEHTWLARRGCALKLLATVQQRAETRHADYRGQLRVERWWTGIWEGRWQA